MTTPHRFDGNYHNNYHLTITKIQNYRNSSQSLTTAINVTPFNNFVDFKHVSIRMWNEPRKFVRMNYQRNLMRTTWTMFTLLRVIHSNQRRLTTMWNNRKLILLIFNPKGSDRRIELIPRWLSRIQSKNGIMGKGISERSRMRLTNAAIRDNFRTTWKTTTKVAIHSRVSHTTWFHERLIQYVESVSNSSTFQGEVNLTTRRRIYRRVHIVPKGTYLVTTRPNTRTTDRSGRTRQQKAAYFQRPVASFARGGCVVAQQMLASVRLRGGCNRLAGFRMWWIWMRSLFSSAGGTQEE